MLEASEIDLQQFRPNCGLNVGSRFLTLSQSQDVELGRCQVATTRRRATPNKNIITVRGVLKVAFSGRVHGILLGPMSSLSWPVFLWV